MVPSIQRQDQPVEGNHLQVHSIPMVSMVLLVNSTIPHTAPTINTAHSMILDTLEVDMILATQLDLNLDILERMTMVLEQLTKSMSEDMEGKNYSVGPLTEACTQIYTPLALDQQALSIHMGT